MGMVGGPEIIGPNELFARFGQAPRPIDPLVPDFIFAGGWEGGPKQLGETSVSLDAAERASISR